MENCGREAKRSRKSQQRSIYARETIPPRFSLGRGKGPSLTRTGRGIIREGDIIDYFRASVGRTIAVSKRRGQRKKKSIVNRKKRVLLL